MVPGIAAPLGRDNLFAYDAANLVACFVRNVDRIRDFRALFRLRLRNIRRLDDVEGVLGVDDRDTVGLDRCSKLLVYLAGILLRNALRRRQGDSGLGLLSQACIGRIAIMKEITAAASEAGKHKYPSQERRSPASCALRGRFVLARHFSTPCFFGYRTAVLDYTGTFYSAESVQR